MKRVLPFFAVLCLVLSLIFVPVQAADSYVFEYDLESAEPYLLDGAYIPEGIYDVQLCFTIDSSIDYSISSIDPIMIVYESTVVDGASVSVCEFTFDVINSVGDTSILAIICGAFSDMSYSAIAFNSSYNDSFKPLDPVSFNATSGYVVFTPVDTIPTLSGFVDSDVMSGVLDQVVVLLPIVLGVLVAYIAVRKGISFLCDFLSRS